MPEIGRNAARQVFAPIGDQVAQSTNATPAQVALAWLMTKPSVVAPLASATTMDQFKDLVAAAHLSLDGAAFDLLESASVPDK